MVPQVTVLIVALFLGFSTSVLGRSGAQIAFIPNMECRLLLWDYQKVEPDGCHSAVSNRHPTDLVDTIRLRTEYSHPEDIPDAIAIYDGDCIDANIVFVIFPYKLEFMDQEFRIFESDEEYIDYPEFAKYKVLNEGSQEWRRLFGRVDRPFLPTDPGNVLYKIGSTWGGLLDKLRLYPPRLGEKPQRKPLELYQKLVGTRPPKTENPNMRLGTLENQFPDSPDPVILRPQLGDGSEMYVTQVNPPAGERYEPWRCEEPLRYKNSLTEISGGVNDMVSPGLLRHNRFLPPRQTPSFNTSPNKARVPDSALPKVRSPSGFSNSQSEPQALDDFDWDLLRPQMSDRSQQDSPNRLGQQPRESPEGGDSASDIPDELAPKETVQLNAGNALFESLLAGLTPLTSRLRRGSISPILPPNNRADNSFISDDSNRS